MRKHICTQKEDHYEKDTFKKETRRSRGKPVNALGGQPLTPLLKNGIMSTAQVITVEQSMPMD